MKINVSESVFNLDGSAAMFEGKPLTLRSVITRSMLTVTEADAATGLFGKVTRYKLAEAASRLDVINISLEEFVVIANAIDVAFTHPLVLRAWFQAAEKAVTQSPEVQLEAQ